MATIESTFGSSPFTSADARASGVESYQLHRLVAHQHVTSPLAGVFQIGSAPLDLPARARAAALVLPPGSALARRTAAWLFGVDARSPEERNTLMDVECTVACGTTPPRRAGLTSYQAELTHGDLTDVEGTPCTTPARTAADLLRWVSPPMGLATVDALAGLGLVLPGDVRQTLERWPGERFVKQGRRLADWIEPLTESFGESWLRLRLLEAGFPRPTAQIPIHDDDGRLVYRLDLGWPDRRIAIEYDGDAFHSSRAAMMADQRRRERLAAIFGWHVVGVGLGDVFGRSMHLEEGVGELLGMAPTISKRLW
jgi:hypothetical protein